jgi:hypothetical protein
MPSPSGWAWFGAWAVVGALAAFSFLSWIGPLVLPVAGLALWAVASRSPGWSTAFGAITGAGLLCLVIWLLNRDYVPCADNGALSGADIRPGETSIWCGGADPQPWLVAAIVLVVAGVGAFALARRRDRVSALG